MSETSLPTLYLVDGSNYVFRAYYAIRELTNAKGFPTNAIYGFTMMLLRLLKEHKPDYLAVAFDVKGPTFRHEAYDGYKATRSATPDTLIPQIPYVKEVVRAFGIPVLERQGVEADDILGTLAATYAAQGLRVFLVSGDKDLMQLVSPSIFQVDTMKEKRYDEAAVREKFGVPPAQVVDVLALAGDASDNVPGVPGIGPKGAQRLIEEFGSVENLLANLPRVKSARARAALEANVDQARMSLDLVRIRTDVALDFDLAASRVGEPDRAALKRLFSEFDFSSLLQEMSLSDPTLAVTCVPVLDEEALAACVSSLRQHRPLAVDLILSPHDGLRGRVVGMALSADAGPAWYVPVEAEGTQCLPASTLAKALSPLMGDQGLPKVGHDLKAIRHGLDRLGIPFRGFSCDTLLAAYVLNPSRRSLELSDLLQEFAGRRVEPLASSGKPLLPEVLPVAAVAAHAASRADAALSLVGRLEADLDRDRLMPLFRDLEMPLLDVLAAMEKHGVLLDIPRLKAMSQEIQGLLDTSLDKIYRLAGERFNVNSPKQLQAILFDKLKLPRGRRTKDGYSTDVEVLTALGKTHDLPAEILAYRSWGKLKSTYVDALPLLAFPATGRVHTSYNQAVTATGRLSSSNPNLQNIPIRTPEGRRIRQAFIAPPGWRILSADYSQIELRLLAHLSEDETLLADFSAGEDIHRRTAANLFGVFPEMVNDAMRRQAKVINFGVLYGMSAFGLSKELDISQKLAQAYIDEYFFKYRGVRAYLDGLIAGARRDGYVSTLLGRRRYLPELASENLQMRQFAERTAINSPIQGTAADLIKKAMIDVDRRLTDERRQARMILQVHDELVLEVPEEEKAPVLRLVREAMEEVVALKVPLKVEVGWGMNWDEAHN